MGTALVADLLGRGAAAGRLSYRGCPVIEGAAVARALNESAATMPPLVGRWFSTLPVLSWLG